MKEKLDKSTKTNLERQETLVDLRALHTSLTVGRAGVLAWNQANVSLSLSFSLPLSSSLFFCHRSANP